MRTLPKLRMFAPPLGVARLWIIQIKEVSFLGAQQNEAAD